MGQQNTITEILNKTSQDSSIYRFISTAELDNWCTKNKICQTVKTYLLANTINNWAEIGPLSFDSVGKIISDSETDICKFLMKNSLIMIGCGANGDPVVIHNNELDPFTAIVFHDEIEFEENEKPTFIKLKDSIEELYTMAYNDKNCPMDAYEAEKKLS